MLLQRRDVCVVTLCVWQGKCLKSQFTASPAAVQAVRVLKKWRNGQDWRGAKKPPSFFLELVVLQALAKGKKSKTANTLRCVLERALHAILGMAEDPGKRVLYHERDPSNNVAASVAPPAWSVLLTQCRGELVKAAATTAPGRR